MNSEELASKAQEAWLVAAHSWGLVAEVGQLSDWWAGTLYRYGEFFTIHLTLNQP